MMSIKEYLQSSFAHELRYCNKHKQEAYSMGCPDCSQIFCAECVNTVGVCGLDGEANLTLQDFVSHDLVSQDSEVIKTAL